VLINAVPVITGQNAITVAEDNSITVTASHLVITDPDNSPAQMTVTIGTGSNYSISGVNTLVPSENYNGPLTVPVVISDGIASSNLFNVAVTVTPVNDAPVVSGIPDQSVEEGEPFDVIDLDLFVTDVETDDNQIVLSYSENTNLNVSIVNRKATISVMNADWTGIDTLVFIATDNDATAPLSASDTAVFTIIEITGINEGEYVRAIAYPNPTSGIVTILFEDPEERDVTIEVLSVHGKVMQYLKQRAIDKRIDLNISNLSSGMYFIRMKVADSVRIFEITKK
jgi:hypothetical protein